MKLGFCGLGNMGTPMAERLLAAGHDLSVWNRTAGRAEALAGLGARVAATPSEAARGADGVISMVADAEALEAVVFGPDGLVGGLAAGTALIDMSTVGPDAVRAVAARLPDGVELLDAPVRGGPTRAAKGELKILLGASDEAAARWTPLLQTLGSVMHVGPPGAGAAAKVLNNFVGVSLVSLLGEAMALADALGIEESQALELLGSTPIRATLQHQWPRVGSGGKPPSFRLRLAAKDLRLALEASGRTTDLPMGRAALDWLGAAVDAGLAEHDQSGVIPHIRSRR